jgi:sugar phosphate isomerase/epimerase
MTRYLGGGWAAVHGPADPKAMLTWTLERGFQGLVPGPGPRARDWRLLAGPMRQLPVSIGAVRAGSLYEVEHRPEQGLCSTNAGDREVALTRIGDVVSLARELGCPVVILEPGSVRVPGEQGSIDLGDTTQAWNLDRSRSQLARRNAVLEPALDAACRSLWELCRRHPDFTFCLTGSRNVLGLGEPRALGLLFEDLRQAGLKYWHDTAIAAVRRQWLGTPEGEWLQAFAGRLAGVTIGDAGDGALYLPPGSGTVDYPLLASYRSGSQRGIPSVVELDPAVEAAEIPGIHAFLDKLGL